MQHRASNRSMAMKQKFPVIDVEREIQKRISRVASKLPHDRRETFVSIAEAPLSALNSDKVSEHFTNHFKRMAVAGKNPTPDMFYEFLNSLTRRVAGYVMRNPNLDSTKAAVYKYQISVSSRSICRIFHPGADCWNKSAIEKLKADAGV